MATYERATLKKVRNLIGAKNYQKLKRLRIQNLTWSDSETNLHQLKSSGSASNTLYNLFIFIRDLGLLGLSFFLVPGSGLGVSFRKYLYCDVLNIFKHKVWNTVLCGLKDFWQVPNILVSDDWFANISFRMQLCRTQETS